MIKGSTTWSNASANQLGGNFGLDSLKIVGLKITSSSLTANAAWLTCAAIACNLLRAAGCLASRFHARARGATIRADLIDVAARLARRGRSQLTLHLPQYWHRESEWLALFEAACGPPARAA